MSIVTASSLATFALKTLACAMLLFGGSIVLMVPWAAGGIGSHRIGQRRVEAPQGRVAIEELGHLGKGK